MSYRYKFRVPEIKLLAVWAVSASPFDSSSMLIKAFQDGFQTATVNRDFSSTYDNPTGNDWIRVKGVDNLNLVSVSV